MARKYLVYEGKNLIGEMNSVEGEKTVTRIKKEIRRMRK